MNTIRASSRSSNISTTSNSTHKSQNVQPRKAKVATMAQMDISSISLPGGSNSNSLNNSLPPSRSSALNNHVQQQQQQRPPIKMRSSGSTVSTTSSIRTGNNNINIHALQRTDTGPIIRVSNGAGSVSGGGGGGSTIGSSNGLSRRVGTSSPGVAGPGGQGSRLGTDGSITSSDDGTVSEDSVEDHIQLFSGAGGLLHGNNLPYGGSGGGSSVSSSRHGSLGPASGPKIAASISGSGTIGRARAATSSNTAAKPMRIAAGASIRVDTSSTVSATASPSQSLNITAPGTVGVGGNGGSATGLLSTSLSSSTSSSSLSWVSSPSHKNGTAASVVGRDDSAVSVTSPTASPNHLPQPPSPGQVSGSGPQPQQSTAARTAKSTSQSTAAAAAAKLAEDNRRAEEVARTRRKIGDLEISNTSLLQVNQTLEATIRKQAAEMQELKMRMQSAQFGGDLSMLTSDLSLAQDPIESNQITPPASDSETAVIIHELTEAERQADLTFKRVCMTIEQMIFEAKQALDQSTKKAGVKVLSSFDMYEKEVADEAEDDDLDTADQSMVLNADDEDLKGSFAEGILDA